MSRFVGLCILLLCLCLTSQAQQVSWVTTKGDASVECANFSDGSLLSIGVFTGQISFYPVDNTPRTSNGQGDIYIQKLDTNGITQWGRVFGGKGQEYINDLAIDKDGNILLIGTFTDSCDFNPGSGVDIGVCKGQTDMFLLKLDSQGNYLWSRRFGGNSYDAVSGLAVDTDGNIYLGGYFTYTVDFSTDSIPFPQNSFGEASGFVMKLNANGERIWFRKYGDGWNPAGVGKMVVVNSKLIIMGNHSSDSLNFGDVFNPLWLYKNQQSQQPYILQLDLNGNVLTVGDFGQWVAIIDVSIDNNSNILLSAYFHGTVDVDPGPNIYNVSASTYGILAIKLDSNANFLWAKTFTTNVNAIVYARKIAAFDQGDILLAAEFRGSVDFDPGSGVNIKTADDYFHDVALIRLNASGELVWLHTYGGNSNDFAGGIAIDADKFYIAGSYRSTVNFNPGGIPYSLTADGLDGYLIKFGNYSALSTPAYEILPPKIYPNPTSGILQFDGAFEHAQLLNLQGQLVYQHANLNEENSLDLSLLNEGVYLLKLIKQGRVSHHKVVVQR